MQSSKESKTCIQQFDSDLPNPLNCSTESSEADTLQGQANDVHRPPVPEALDDAALEKQRAPELFAHGERVA